MKSVFSSKLKNLSNTFYFLLNLISFLYNIKFCSNCDIANPIKKNDECINVGCTIEEFKSNICTIENDIIKTQWITQLIIFSEYGVSYSTLATTPNNDLICISSHYSTSNTKQYFYALKNNGRSYFLKDNEETPFNEVDSGTQRNEGNIFGINLNGGDKEYIIGYGNNFAYFELYDFEDNNRVYNKEGKSFFETGFINFRKGSIFKYNNYYFISFVGQTYSTEYKTFFIKKFLFSKKNINENSAYTQQTVTKYSTDTYMSSCFLSLNNYIICFYLDSSKIYNIIVYNDNLGELASTTITSTYYSNDDFYKCIHFTQDAGAFLYIDTDNNIAIQFKKYYNYRVTNFFTTKDKIKINNNNYHDTTKTCDMIKLTDKKFCVVFISTDYTELNFYIINNYKDEQIKIRHYNIKISNLYFLTITQELNLSLYKGFIAMSSVIDKDSTTYASLMIFSYANSTDFSIDITDNLTSFTNPIIKFYENCKLENNIFGYSFLGFRISDYSDGFKLLCFDDKEEIPKDVVLTYDTDVELILTNEINIEENGRILFEMVVEEPDYDIYNQYPTEIDETYCGTNCNDEKDTFSKQWYFGRTSYCDITFNLDIITNDCNENCIICKKDHDRTCIMCRYLYILLSTGGKKCLNENEIPPTGITTPETTIITTIPTTILTTIPTTILTTIPTTILTTIPKKETTTTTPLTEDTIITTTYINSIITSTKISYIESTFISSNQNENESDKNINTNAIINFTSENSNTESSLNKEKNCENEEIINGKCNNGRMTANQIEEIKNMILNKNYTKENTIIKTENVLLQLSTLEDQKNSDNIELSNIDLGECENLLKDNNNMSRDDSLIIFKVDIKSKDLSSTYVTYEVFHPITLKPLNLSICNNVEISINVPIKLDNNFESLVNSLSESGYNIFNENDSFYNDICSTYTTENGTDILLSDRKKDIFEIAQNKSICQIGCELQEYNSTSKKAKCDCSINTNTNTHTEEIKNLDIDNLFSKKEIAKSFYDTLANSNFQVLKCYKLIFSKISKNVGEILMSILFIIFIILTIIYFISGQKKIIIILNNIIKLHINDNKKNITKENKIKEQNQINHNHNNRTKKKSNSLKNTIRKSLKSENKNNHSPPKKLRNNSKNTTIKTSKHQLINKKQSDKILSRYNNKSFNSQLKKQNTKKHKSNNNLYRKNDDKTKKHKANEITIYSNTKNLLNTHTNEKHKNHGKHKKSKIEGNKSQHNYFKNLNDQELNTLEYLEAIHYDKRTYFQYYWSLLKKKQLILFTFFPSDDYNLKTIKIALFIISFSLYFTINGFFFRDDTMHKIYEDNGEYNFLFQIPQILYSSVVSSVINIILKQLSLSEKNILKLKRDKDNSNNVNKSKQLVNCLKKKFIIFFTLSFLFMLFFWYFITCFCAVYTNTQMILIKDTLISFCTSMLYPFGLNLLPGIFRIPALRAKNKDKKCLYNASLIIALI